MEFAYFGWRIKSRRLELGWSQDGLCRGICAVSYLSKIEQGKAEASPEILRLLFERLGLPWFDDEDTCAGSEELAERCYEAVFSCDDGAFGALRDEFFAEYDRMSNSRRALDAAILKAWFSSPQAPADESMESYFSPRQLAVQRILQGRAEEAMKIYPCAYASLMTGISHYNTGTNYAYAIDALRTAYDIAASEGRANIMLTARMFMGNCYCNQLDTVNMEKQYAIASRLATALGSTEYLATIKYNAASSYIETHRYDKAYAYFSSIRAPGVMELHKLAICCEKLGKRREALDALDRAEAEAVESFSGVDSRLAGKMCSLVRQRLENENYLESAQYGAELMDVFNECRDTLPVGYASFHLPWVLEWYTATRQYRAAYELLQDFPLKK